MAVVYTVGVKLKFPFSFRSANFVTHVHPICCVYTEQLNETIAL